jgi:hypothetical protein
VIGVEFEEHFVYFTTSRARAAALYEAGEICCTPLEYTALAVALGDGSLTREGAMRELARKLEPAGHVIELPRLLGGVKQPDRWGSRWTFGELFTALGAVLVDVVVEEGDDT